jgi:rod shape-determining protein MreD
MSKIIVYTLAIILLLALNVVFPAARFSAPNFLFLLVVVYAFRKDNPDFLWLAFFAGIMLDVYSNVFFGTFTLSFMIISLVINYTTRTFFSADPSVIYMGAVVAATNLILIGLIYFINSIGLGFEKNLVRISGEYLANKVWADVALNLFFAAPIYFFSIWIDSIINHYQNKQQSI